jgi:hypothetical protein
LPLPQNRRKRESGFYTNFPNAKKLPYRRSAFLVSTLLPFFGTRLRY